MRIALLLLLVASSCCVATTPAPTTQFKTETASVEGPRQDLDSPLAMLESTVQLQVTIEATMTREDQETKTTSIKPVKTGWTGSGVVYANNGKRSLILSANHVLQTPAVGSVEDVTVGIFGVEMVLGQRRIDKVTIEAKTASGDICNVTVLALGVDDHRDVATASVDCDAGRVAPIATSTPARGEKVYVSGHSRGSPLALVTDGYVSGVMEHYLLVSAAAAPGNSGGPVFYQGRIIGLLVRGHSAYSHMSLVTPLESVLLRVAETPGLD
jgi:S1-C subfamily serine protease